MKTSLAPRAGVPGDVVFAADSGNHPVRKITPAGNVNTLAGSPTTGVAIIEVYALP